MKCWNFIHIYGNYFYIIVITSKKKEANWRWAIEKIRRNALNCLSVVHETFMTLQSLYYKTEGD